MSIAKGRSCIHGGKSIKGRRYMISIGENISRHLPTYLLRGSAAYLLWNSRVLQTDQEDSTQPLLSPKVASAPLRRLPLQHLQRYSSARVGTRILPYPGVSGGGETEQQGVEQGPKVTDRPRAMLSVRHDPAIEDNHDAHAPRLRMPRHAPNPWHPFCQSDVSRFTLPVSPARRDPGASCAWCAHGNPVLQRVLLEIIDHGRRNAGEPTTGRLRQQFRVETDRIPAGVKTYPSLHNAFLPVSRRALLRSDGWIFYAFRIREIALWKLQPAPPPRRRLPRLSCPVLYRS